MIETTQEEIFKVMSKSCGLVYETLGSHINKN